jgi:formylglycine-generating enzyme required for sulfatase activity
VAALLGGYGALAIACGTFSGADSTTATGGDASDAMPTTDAVLPDGAGDVASPDASAADAAGPGADAGGGPCPSGTEGPPMVKIPNSVTTGSPKGLCIDRTEVTNEEYNKFFQRVNQTAREQLASKVPEACKSLAAQVDPGAQSNYLPRVNVSFCSAAFYCAAQDKRLCGSFDGAAVVTKNGQVDPPLEWELACSNGQDTSFYPWGSGSASAAAACHTSERDAAAPREVGAVTTCGPSADGPFDMIGNVWEWVSLRADNQNASYTGVRGGAWEGPVVGNGCKTGHGMDAPREMMATGRPTVGFRCCASVF